METTVWGTLIPNYMKIYFLDSDFVITRTPINLISLKHIGKFFLYRRDAYTPLELHRMIMEHDTFDPYFFRYYKGII